ncbi:ComEA family DNA-binding protein [Dehalogenimonas sp. THU2]|uniref:ComEA family DNA-binding protein n=1 Tax=Dehalogenimonas sp. THU2 TaxID=3151121 RepID=UPI00321890BD
MSSRLRHLTAAVFLLPTLLLSACADSTLVEIYTPTTQSPPFATVAIEGAVNLPGVYPMKSGDTVEDLLQAAGGATGGSSITLIVGGSTAVPQRVNLNTADLWLLVALPGVGESRASAIIDYRISHGPFVNILELTKVQGFGQATFDALKDLITVSG